MTIIGLRRHSKYFKRNLPKDVSENRTVLNYISPIDLKTLVCLFVWHRLKFLISKKRTVQCLGKTTLQLAKHSF